MAKHNRRKKWSDWRLAMFFAWRNLKQQKMRTLLYAGIILVSAVVSFVFIGEISIYRDDRITKKYDDQAYLQKNDMRLVVRKLDNSEITQKDAAAMREIKDVVQVDQYDYANDVNYYFWEDKDYRYTYSDAISDKEKEQIEAKGQPVKQIGVELLNKDNFMRSSTCLKKEDLAAGRLPESRLEVVVYAASPDILNTGQRCYFSSENLWLSGQTCYQELKIVGILKEKTRQVYFHPELCRMLTVGVDGYLYSMDYCYDQWTDNYHYKRWFYPLISDDLKKNEMRISQNFVMPETDPKDGTLEQLTLERAFLGHSLPFHIFKDTTESEEYEQDMASFGMGEEAEYVRYEKGDLGGQVEILMEMCDQGPWFVEVSSKLFDELYPEGTTTQASVYISSYGRTDKVLHALHVLGYDAISTYRVGSTKYESKKVYQRLEILVLSCVVLIFAALLEILLLRYLLKQRRKEYKVLQFMGMRERQLSKIGFLELGIPGVVVNILTLLAFWAAGVFCFRPVAQILQYQTVQGLMLYLVYNGGLILLGGLQGKMLVLSLRTTFSGRDGKETGVW